MDNMLWTKEYSLILNNLEQFIKEKKLDKITVKSLMLSSIDFIYPEEEPANIAIISQDDLSKSYSIKCENIKIGLKFALDIIFSVKAVFSSEECWLILSVLKVISSFINGMKEELNCDEAIVLFSLYRLQSADEGRIKDYINSLKDSGKLADINIENINIKTALDKLEKIKSIELDGGDYHIIETIYIKQRN